MPSHLVYDVGMHNGDDTAFYLAQRHRVVAVEADPRLAEAGARRFAREVEDGRLTIANVGVAPDDGEAEFWVCDGFSEWSSFDRDVATRAGHAAHAVRVPTRRFARLLEEHGRPHYLKIDIEGSDRLCLEGLRPDTAPPYLSVEAECGTGRPRRRRPDAPGRWMDPATAERAFRFWRARHFRKTGVSPFSFWCDWHAARE